MVLIKCKLGFAQILILLAVVRSCRKYEFKEQSTGFPYRYDVFVSTVPYNHKSRQKCYTGFFLHSGREREITNLEIFLVKSIFHLYPENK